MKKKVAAILAAAAVFVSAMPLSAAAADTTAPYVESDTTMNFLVEQGKTYTFKMTVHGTHANPNIVMGNGAAFQTREVRKVTENGNDVYYFKVLATGEEGQAAGIYTTLPGQPSVKHAVAAIPYVANDAGKTYTVGEDIAPGEYVLTTMLVNASVDAYWGYYQVNSADGTLYNNGQLDGESARAYVTVSEGQTLKLEDMRMVAIQNAVRALPDADGTFSPGYGSYYGTMYKCGYDLKPGTYTVVYDAFPEAMEPYNKTYALIYNTSAYSKFDDPVSSIAFSSGSQQITIKDGQYLDLSRGVLIPNSLT